MVLYWEGVWHYIGREYVAVRGVGMGSAPRLRESLLCVRVLIANSPCKLCQGVG